jgi:sugar lactone lactonase YvrE
LGPDGTVYVADSTGAILRLRPRAEATLETLLAPGALASPQGMAVTPDGRALIVVDYSSGLHRIDLATGASVRLGAPPGASLIGVDGLTRDGDALYAIQNGVAPQRVLRLTLNPAWTAIEGVEVIAANLPEMDEPTTGLVHDGGLVFVSRSQWSDFDEDGAPKPGADGPAIIARLRLD